MRNNLRNDGWRCSVDWGHWAIGVGWLRSRNLPGWDPGSRTVWEFDALLVAFYLGPVRWTFIRDGPRRDVRPQVRREMYEAN